MIQENKSSKYIMTLTHMESESVVACTELSVVRDTWGPSSDRRSRHKLPTLLQKLCQIDNY